MSTITVTMETVTDDERRIEVQRYSIDVPADQAQGAWKAMLQAIATVCVLFRGFNGSSR